MWDSILSFVTEDKYYKPKSQFSVNMLILILLMYALVGKSTHVRKINYNYVKEKLPQTKTVYLYILHVRNNYDSCMEIRLYLFMSVI